MPNESVCEDCKGTGQRRKDDYTFEQCGCSYRRMLRHRLGDEIASAKTLYESAFYVPGHGPVDPPEKDLTLQNLHVRGLWSDVISHLKWAFGCKLGDTGLIWRFRIVTDERLRTVWVGSESYMSRSRKRRDDMETFNSLSDYVGDDFDLVLIRLGHLGYRNVAMPGILKETLMLRQTIRKATWVVEELDRPFQEGHFSWNPDVADYLERNFETIAIEPSRAVEEIKPHLEADPDLMAAEEEPSRPAPKGIIDSVLGGQEQDTKWKPSRKGRKPGGKPAGKGPLG